MIAYLFWHRAYPTTTVEQCVSNSALANSNRQVSVAVPRSMLRPCPGLAIGPDTKIGAC